MRLRVMVASGLLTASLIAGCSRPPAAENPPPLIITPTSRQLSPVPADPTAALTATITSPAPVPTPEPQPGEVCSPLHGFQLSQLSEIVSNPFEMPLPGSDGGHHGVDFSFYRYGAYEKMQGLRVNSMLDGVVAGIIDDRPPYGNAILIETRLEDLPALWQQYLTENLTQPEEYPEPRLFCPSSDELTFPDSVDRSLYLLYAHLERLPAFNLANSVQCGEQVGFVGTSGYSVNAHLHLEMRIGPAGYQVSQLGHYAPDSSPEEMANYCTWRVSGRFMLLDPMVVINMLP